MAVMRSSGGESVGTDSPLECLSSSREVVLQRSVVLSMSRLIESVLLSLHNPSNEQSKKERKRNVSGDLEHLSGVGQRFLHRAA